MPSTLERARAPFRAAIAAAALTASAMAINTYNQPEETNINRDPMEQQSGPEVRRLGGSVVLAAAQEEAPPPPPDHCSDYVNMEWGRGHPVNQEWFNGLDERGYARVRMACEPRYAWGGRQFDCLDRLWGPLESKWDRLADNPKSTAFGIWQGTLSSRRTYQGAEYASTDGRTQVRGGLEYVLIRHDTPCQALSFRLAKGYY